MSNGTDAACHPVIHVLALYQLGLLKMGLGDEDEGGGYLERFLDHWGDAECDLTQVSDARARLGLSAQGMPLLSRYCWSNAPTHDATILAKDL